MLFSSRQPSSRQPTTAFIHTMSLVSGDYFISNVGTTTYLGLGPRTGIRFPIVNTNEMTPNVTVRMSLPSTCSNPGPQVSVDVCPAPSSCLCLLGLFLAALAARRSTLEQSGLSPYPCRNTRQEVMVAARASECEYRHWTVPTDLTRRRVFPSQK